MALTVVVDEWVAGNVGCWKQDGQRLAGYWIGKEFWGQGVATQMLSTFLSVIAERPLHAQVAKHNVASIRVLEKCGFAYCAEATGALGEPADGVEEFVYVFDRAESKEKLKLELFIFARFHARPGNESAVAKALLNVIAPTREEAGCLGIHAYRSLRDR